MFSLGKEIRAPLPSLYLLFSLYWLVLQWFPFSFPKTCYTSLSTAVFKGSIPQLLGGFLFNSVFPQTVKHFPCKLRQLTPLSSLLCFFQFFEWGVSMKKKKKKKPATMKWIHFVLENHRKKVHYSSNSYADWFFFLLLHNFAPSAPKLLLFALFVFRVHERMMHFYQIFLWINFNK